jgi:hypothetical protein
LLAILLFGAKPALARPLNDAPPMQHYHPGHDVGHSSVAAAHALAETRQFLRRAYCDPALKCVHF